MKDLSCHLHCHTTHSYLDAVSTVEEYLIECQKRDMQYMAITDHGYITAMHELLTLAPKYNIKPIVGNEIYVDISDQHNGKDTYGHLTLLSNSDKGLKNILKLFNLSFNKMSKSRWGLKKPLVSWDELEEYNEGLFCGSGCLTSTLSKNLMKDKPEAAIYNLDRLIAIFGKNRIFAEFMPHHATHDWNPKTRQFEPNQCRPWCMDGDLVKGYQEWLYEKAVVERGLKPVTTLDSHFAKPEDKVTQDLVLGAAEGGWKFHGSYHLLNPQEIFDNLRYLPRHGEKLHDEMMDNALHFCSGIQYNPISTTLKLPEPCVSVEEGIKKFVSLVDMKAVEKIKQNAAV